MKKKCSGCNKIIESNIKPNEKIFGYYPKEYCKKCSKVFV